MSIEPTHSLDPIEPTAFPILPRMTEADYFVWEQEGVRAEWVDGEVVIMSPANQDHARIADWLTALFLMYVEKFDLGDVLSDYRVRLGPQRRIRDPDLAFISKDRLEQIRSTHVEGPPDMIVEIVSPDSAGRDYREKYLEYEAAGVREYWIVDPLAERLEVWWLEVDEAGKARYRPIEVKDGKAMSVVLPSFYLRPEWLWSKTRPKLMVACRELGIA